MGRLDRFLGAKSIAVLGGATAERAIIETRALGYTGEIWPIHPQRAEMAGIPCIRSISELPGIPDGAFIGVNRDLAIEAVADLAKIGAGGAVVHASGFAESGSRGANYGERLLKAAGDMPMVGPNCLGLINYLDGVALWSDLQGSIRVDGGVAVLTQSGALAQNITMHSRALRIAFLINLGNQLSVDFAQCIEAMVADARVTAIAMHLEGVADALALDRALRVARQSRKPVVILKSGKSPAGAALTQTHTASLAGSESVFRAFVERSGAVEVSSISELIETAKLLDMFGPLPGSDAVALAYSGGEASLVADAAVGTPVAFNAFSEIETSRIGCTVADLVTVSNPFDFHTFDWAKSERLEATFTAVAQARFDVALLMMTLPKPGLTNDAVWWILLEAYARAMRVTARPAIVVSQLAEGMPEAAALRCKRLGLVAIADLDVALNAIAASTEIGRNFEAPSAAALVRIETPASAPVRLTEWQAKETLARMGIAVPEGRLVYSVAGARSAAAALGGPVAVKAVGPDILHKTEMNAVRLNLTDLERIEAAAAELLALGDGVLIERMVPRPVAEFILGVAYDAAFGMHMLIGAGGIIAELVKDTRCLLFPFTREDALDALHSLRTFALVEGFRGRPKGDVGALVEIMMAVQKAVISGERSFHDLEINPILVCAEGKGAIAVDAVMATG